PASRRARTAGVPFLGRMQWEAIQASPRLLAALGEETLRAMEDSRWATWPAPDEVAFVAEDDAQRPLGALILRVNERAGERVAGYRLAMAVEADVRGRGVGRQLIERAKRHVAEHGADYLLLLVDPANETARRTYQAAGFELGDQHGVVPMILRHGDAPPG